MADARSRSESWGVERHDEWCRFTELTEQDKHILRLTARGVSSSAIAEDLYVMPVTVRARQEHLARYFALASPADYAALAARLDRASECTTGPIR
jgi:DNA-binding NarL/FixJ family response regulator